MLIFQSKSLASEDEMWCSSILIYWLLSEAEHTADEMLMEMLTKRKKFKNSLLVPLGTN